MVKAVHSRETNLVFVMLLETLVPLGKNCRSTKDSSYPILIHDMQTASPDMTLAMLLISG